MSCDGSGNFWAFDAVVDVCQGCHNCMGWDGNVSDEPTYYFCETVTAGPVAPWHIRKGTDKGPFFGGGADTLALCGREVAWDLDVEINERQLEAGTCSKCRKLYEDNHAEHDG